MVDMRPRTDSFKAAKLNDLYESKLRVAAFERHRRTQTQSTTGSIEVLQTENRIQTVLIKDLKSEPYHMTDDDIQNELLLIHEKRRKLK